MTRATGWVKTNNGEQTLSSTGFKPHCWLQAQHTSDMEAHYGLLANNCCSMERWTELVYEVAWCLVGSSNTDPIVVGRAWQALVSIRLADCAAIHIKSEVGL